MKRGHILHDDLAETTQLLLMERENESIIIDLYSFIPLNHASSAVSELDSRSFFAAQMLWRGALAPCFGDHWLPCKKSNGNSGPKVCLWLYLFTVRFGLWLDRSGPVPAYPTRLARHKLCQKDERVSVWFRCKQIRTWKDRFAAWLPFRWQGHCCGIIRSHRRRAKTLSTCHQ